MSIVLNMTQYSNHVRILKFFYSLGALFNALETHDKRCSRQVPLTSSYKMSGLSCTTSSHYLTDM